MKAVIMKDDHGQSMLEFIISFPLVLIVVLAVIQLSLLAQTRLFLEYAAFNSARAAIVQPDNLEAVTDAARLSMTPISPALDKVIGLGVLTDTINSVSNAIAGISSLPFRYAYARQFTNTKFAANTLQNDDDITVHVDYLAYLYIPLVNRLIGQKGSALLKILSDYSNNTDNGWLSTIDSVIGNDYFYPLSTEITLSIEQTDGSEAADPSKCTYSYTDNKGLKHNYTYDEVYKSGTYKNGRSQYHTDKKRTGISRIVKQECP